jgi:hypothetical protein
VRGKREYIENLVFQRSGAMLSKLSAFAVAVILAVPLCAAGGTSPAGGNSAGASAAGHSGGANGSVAHSGGFNGHALASHTGIAHTDAMHATHLATGKHSEVERTSSKSPCMDGHCYQNRREPTHNGQGSAYATNQQPIHICMTGARVWWDCGAPTKSR